MKDFLGTDIKKEIKGGRFTALRISLRSPEEIREASNGEVKKPETINYRTHKPETYGLFCTKIFGPVKDYNCLCGRYKKRKYQGLTCEKCGVKITSSAVRRKWMGHIELATPAIHPWFFKPPSKIGYLLNYSTRQMNEILYNDSYVVIKPGETNYAQGDIISEDEYYELLDLNPEEFFAERGAEAFLAILQSLDLKTLSDELREEFKTVKSMTKKKKISQRLKIVESFHLSGNKPEWMILRVIPILPPDLRPLVPLEGGRFATSDLNDLYRRIITRNNRLKKLIEIGAPTIIIRNEKRMLQSSVNSLFDNSSGSNKPAKSTNGRPLKSLTDSLKGKRGRFRQHLLGKRVDYSGRSVITVGPDLKLHQCGLPKKMALELFKPFIFNKLIEHGIVTNVKSAKRMVDERKEVVFGILEDIVKEHPVLLNRAPTLHRLGIQAFEPVLIESKAIQLHPLVCVAFNADFDGDQMAVHLPLSIEAQIEARVLMMSTNNILSPASGKPIIGPAQDMVLGIYYITREKSFRKGEGMIFSSPEEARMALEFKAVEVHSKVKVLINGVLEDTTPGRMLFWEITPQDGHTENGKGLEFKEINKVLGKKEINHLLHRAFITAGSKATVLFADSIKNLGFTESTKSGISINVNDMIIPPNKKELVDKAQGEVDSFKDELDNGHITEDEYNNKTKTVWEKTTDAVAKSITKHIEKDIVVNPETGEEIEEMSFNSVFIMKDSGARGSDNQIKQLSGMRGLMAKPNGDIIITPIKANFREGLSSLEYFISTHGARKGLSDTALKTASSGYLTRKLVDVAHDAIITSYDCGTITGIEVDIDENSNLKEDEKKEIFVGRILGRLALEDVINTSGEIIVKKGEEINEEKVEEILDKGVEVVNIRSVLTCKSRRGVCRRCYGRDLARRELVNIGEAIGVIASQSIGEPGTQLVMRVFHQGGIATGGSFENIHKANVDGKIFFDRINTITAKNKLGEDIDIVVTRNGKISLFDKNGREKDQLSVEYGTKLFVKNKMDVKKGDQIFESNPHSKLIISEVAGRLKFVDLISDLTFREEEIKTKGSTGITNTIVKIIEHKGKKAYKPAIMVVDEMGEPIKVRTRNGKDEFAIYYLPKEYNLQSDIARFVTKQGKDSLGPIVEIGKVLATKAKATVKNQDIVAGLPKVEELFEARKPKEIAIVAEIDGVIEFGKSTKTRERIRVVPKYGKTKKYEFSKKKETIVKDGDFIRAGEPLTEGAISPHDILKVKGTKELSKFLVKEIQKVYRSQGVTINDKHIEVIVRQMLRKVQITSLGDSVFLMGENVDRFRFEDEMEKLLAIGKKPATARNLLLGISRSALTTESFLSAASFQETTKVLTNAAINGKIDHLLGLKENVLMGRLIPAGTGIQNYSKLEMEIVSNNQLFQ